MAKKFDIETTAGTITVEEWESEDYPGVTIYLNGEQLVVVERRPQKPQNIHVAVWSNPDVDPMHDDDFTIDEDGYLEWVGAN